VFESGDDSIFVDRPGSVPVLVNLSTHFGLQQIILLG